MLPYCLSAHNKIYLHALPLCLCRVHSFHAISINKFTHNSARFHLQFTLGGELISLYKVCEQGQVLSGSDPLRHRGISHIARATKNAYLNRANTGQPRTLAYHFRYKHPDK